MQATKLSFYQRRCRKSACPAALLVGALASWGCSEHGNAERARYAGGAGFDRQPSGAGSTNENLGLADPGNLDPGGVDPGSVALEPGFDVNGLPTTDLALAAPEPARMLDVATRTDLAPFFPADARLVGVAVNPLDGSRYVLEAARGIYKLEDGGARLVFSLPDATVTGGDSRGLPPAELTDMTLMIRYHEDGGNLVSTVQFVLTAENEGYVLAPGSSILQSYFCYLPPTTAWIPTENPSVSERLRAQGVAVKERTNAVAVNDSSGQIFAQPRTFRMDDGTIAGSELFVFDQGGGQPFYTRGFAGVGFAAGGMLSVGRTLALGYGPDLYQVGGWAAQSAERVGTVDGVGSIEGMAQDNDDLASLVLLDAANKQLVTITIAEFYDWPSENGP